jgi:large subunit ribosomal protein L10
MSKPVKELLRKELIKRLQGVSSLAVVGFTGIDAVTTHQIRGQLRDKEIRLMVVKNSIARQAFDAVGLEGAKDLIDGPCALAFSAEADKVEVVTVVRELLNIGKEAQNLTVKAAVLEGELFGSDRIAEFSRFPTRDEAISKLVTCVLCPGTRLAGCLIGPGAKIAALLKAIREKKESENDTGGEQAA